MFQKEREMWLDASVYESERTEQPLTITYSTSGATFAGVAAEDSITVGKMNVGMDCVTLDIEGLFW